MLCIFFYKNIEFIGRIYNSHNMSITSTILSIENATEGLMAMRYQFDEMDLETGEISYGEDAIEFSIQDSVLTVAHMNDFLAKVRITEIESVVMGMIVQQEGDLNDLLNQLIEVRISGQDEESEEMLDGINRRMKEMLIGVQVAAANYVVLRLLYNKYLRALYKIQHQM